VDQHDPKLSHLLRETPGRIALTDTIASPDGKAAVEAMHSLVGWPEIRRRILMLPDAAEVGDSLAVPVAQPEPEVAGTDSAKDTAKMASKPEAREASNSRILTDAFLPQPLLWGTPIAGTGRWVPVDTSLAPPLYPSVVQLKSINPSRGDAAKAFLQFLQSPRGVSILRAKGFLPPPG